MQPSEKYAVDYTDGNGLKWTKTIATLYPSLGVMDNSIGISKYNAAIMRKIYRKPDSFNPLYDNAITIGALPGQSPNVIKYFSRNAYPVSDANINTIIVNASTADGGAYAIGVDDDASNVINRASMGSYRILRDAEYNKMLFNVRVREMSFTTHNNVIQKDLYEDPTYTDKNLKDIDDDKYYAIFYHLDGKVWNGASWVDSAINPAYICTGSDIQTIQGAGSVFNNTFTTYSAAPLGSGQNIDLYTSSSNYYWSGENFNCKMNNVRYCLGLSEDITLKGSWTDNPDAVYGTIRHWLIDNSIAANVRVNFEVCRELIPVENDSVVLLTQTMNAYLDNSNNLVIWGSTVHTFFMIKGSSLNKMIAGFGLYYLTDENADLTGITPNTLHNSSAIWLGEMSADGTTTGNWIKGADIENYTGYNKDGNTVNPGFNPSGGGGGGDDDDIDELTFGSYSGGAGAFANVWYTTATELGNLKTWMNKAPGSGGPPSGYNPMDSILSLMIYPIAIPTAGSLVHISFFNANDPDNHLISSDAQGYFTEGKTFEIDLGSYTIDPHHDSDWAYLDYDTAIELYIPFCGVYQIDTQVVMGTTLSAKMWVDPVMGSCTFCAYANNIPVAMGSGNLGVSLPISSQQFSMVQAAMATNRGSFAAGAIGTILGAVASALVGGMAGSAAALKKSYGSLQMARGVTTRPGLASLQKQISGAFSNTFGTGATSALVGKATGEIYNVYRTNKMLAAGNSTAVSGSFGGSQDPWRLPMTPYVKILRERTHVSDMHVSTTGKLRVMGATLNECTGFTTVVNPDLSGLTDILTQSELAEIYTTLCNGVYC